MIALLVISLGIHEAAHAWVALKCGDSTGRDLGRLTLNPMVHIDPIMSILLPVVLLLTTGFIFGGAKPVPVNFHNLRQPYRDMAMVASAGPLTNLVLAAFFILVYHVVVNVAGVWEPRMLGPRVLEYAVFFNLLLTAFNLIPIPPLDGSRVLAWLLPASLRSSYQRIEGFGLFLIFALIFLVPGFQRMLLDTIYSLEGLLRSAVTLGGLW